VVRNVPCAAHIRITHSPAGTFPGCADNQPVMTPHEATVTAQSDAAVIVASLARPSEFAEIFDRHFRTIHRYVARRVGRERADDIAAHCFTIAFEHRGGFRPDADTARPWLLGIATNLLREHWRAERRQLETAARLGRERLVDARAPATRDADPELAAALATLDQDQLDVLLLYAWAELSYEQIATTLAVPVGTVRSRLARARSRLRAELARESTTSEETA
jgi:RNA polymerase sigma factor (sigma-70 family)